MINSQTKTKIAKLKLVLIPIFLLLVFTAKAEAKEYYVSNSGSDSNPGTAEQPWKSISKVSSFNFQAGDDVYFKCGDTFAPSSYLNVDWEGIESNSAVIGAYYMSGGNPVHGVNGSRPIISGSEFEVPENKHFGTTDRWKGLINVRSKDYVHIKNLKILKSGFQGIRITGDLEAGANSAHFLVKNVKVEGAYNSGIMIAYNKNNHGVIEGCEVSGAGYGWKLGTQHPWPVSLVVAQSPYSYTTVRRNYVHENWGEGIGSIRVPDTEITAYSGYATIEDNIVWNNRRVDIYVDRTEGNIIRRNLLLGAGGNTVGGFTSKNEYNRNWNQFGIWINVEERGLSGGVNVNNNSIYNNLIAGHAKGMGLGSTYDTGTIKNIYFFNNTLIGNAINIYIGSRLSGYTMKNVELKNNTSYCPKDAICSDINRDPSWLADKFIWSNNAWTTKPTYASGPGDILVDNNFAKTTGWQDLTEADVAGIAEKFKLTSNSNAIDQGVALQDFTEDFFKNTRSGTWDIGAHEYGGASTPTEYCGDGNCNNNETCKTCPEDCDPCPTAPTHSAQRTYQTISIDGDLTEFNLSKTLTLSDPTTNTTGNYHFLWDDQNLYIGAEVTDTQLNSSYTNYDEALWKDDAIELLFDTGNDKTTLSTDDFKFFVNLNNAHADAHGDGGKLNTSWNSIYQSAVNLTGTLNQPDTDNSYTLEIAIPWNQFASPPTEGTTWGFDLGLRIKNDDQNSSYQMWSNTDGADPNNPEGWGEIIFQGLPDPCQNCQTLAEPTSAFTLADLDFLFTKYLMNPAYTQETDINQDGDFSFSDWVSGQRCYVGR